MLMASSLYMGTTTTMGNSNNNNNKGNKKGRRLLLIVVLLFFSLITYVYFLNVADNRLGISDDGQQQKKQEKQHQLEQQQEKEEEERQQQQEEKQIHQNQNQQGISKITKHISSLPSFNLSTSKSLYSSVENNIMKADVTWADFIDKKQEKIRSTYDNNNNNENRFKKLTLCNYDIVSNLTSKPSNEDVAKGIKYSCDEEWGDALIDIWKKKQVKGLCEEGPSIGSKINCYDSPLGNSRYCVFENAMMNFKKMRKITKQDGAMSRQWERGFLAADCGFEGKDDIGYLQVYKPDIDGSSDAICDYVFNETVLAYSHSNIKSMGHFVSDYLNVWSTLWLTGNTQNTRDISFLNIDAMRTGRCYDDQPNQYFKHYDQAFRRILKGIDFGTSNTVCFKKLIMQPRPQIPFMRDGWKQDSRCSFIGPSSIFQRWNFQFRQMYGLLNEHKMPTLSKMKILLVVRPIGSTSASDVLRTYQNKDEIELALANTISGIPNTNLIVQDLSKLPFDDQIKLLASTSIIIGMHGTAMASTVHMPIGTKNCCGVIEIFPDGDFKYIRGYGNLARRMGHHYSRLELSSNNTNSNTNTNNLPGSYVPPTSLIEKVTDMIATINTRSSCILPSVVKKKY